ncbi:MAG: hypothetical protein AAGG51_27530 [Cyanobacteria bacterium P01_G01_bin.54]
MTHKIEFDEFAESIREIEEDLEFSGSAKHLESDGAYQVSMTVKNNLVIIYTTPKSKFKDQYRMHSYAKAGIWDESKNEWGQYVACKTHRTTMTQIETPVIKNSILTCGDNSFERLCDEGKWRKWFKSRITLFFSKR